MHILIWIICLWFNEGGGGLNMHTRSFKDAGESATSKTIISGGFISLKVSPFMLLSALNFLHILSQQLTLLCWFLTSEACSVQGFTRGHSKTSHPPAQFLPKPRHWIISSSSSSRSFLFLNLCLCVSVMLWFDYVFKQSRKRWKLNIETGSYCITH